MDDNRLQLYEYGSDGEVTKRAYKGAWLLVDNGYLSWPTTVPPIKTTTSRAEIQFSAWLESMCKDVECTFGILKGRWRILKTGICLFGTNSADKIFLTCCALHNWLLEIDGLDERWDEGVQSEWEGPLGDHQHEVHDTSRAYVNLRNPAYARNYGTSAFGLVGGDIAHDDEDPVLPAPRLTNLCAVGDAVTPRTGHGSTTVQKVRHLTLDEFCKRLLVTHFDIAFHRNELRWPRRSGGHKPAQNL
ncbi:Plant transposon protein [Fragilaria crotonensis]|nr:Plant transposon protein [Fragilaria crotonensis]